MGGGWGQRGGGWGCLWCIDISQGSRMARDIGLGDYYECTDPFIRPSPPHSFAPVRTHTETFTLNRLASGHFGIMKGHPFIQW